VFEVKTKKIFSKRNCRQEEALKALSEYLLTDKTDNLYGIGKMKRESMGFPEVNYIDKLNELIEIAYKRGYCTKEIENGLFYSVITNTENDDFIKLILEKVKKPYVVFINQAKYETVGYYPFTLSIEEPELLLSFYRGDMLITVCIDMDVMTNELLKHGLKLSIEEDSEGEEFPFVIADSASIDLKDIYMRISRHFFGRIAFEFLSLKWFIDEIVYKVSKLKEEYKSS
jgi:hypothetical protein